MKQRWMQLVQRFDALNKREKVLIVASMITAIIISWYHFVSAPMFDNTKKLSQEIVELQSTVDDLKQQHHILVDKKQHDPHRDVRERITKFETELNGINRQLSEKFHALIEPKQMAQVLESVLAQHKSLRLIRVKSLAATPLIDEQEVTTTTRSTKKENHVEVYSHGLQIEFEGSYMATLSYLKTLESLPWEFYWDAVLLNVEQYPRSHIIIKVHTISLRDSWIGV